MIHPSGDSGTTSTVAVIGPGEIGYGVSLTVTTAGGTAGTMSINANSMRYAIKTSLARIILHGHYIDNGRTRCILF